MHTLYYKTTLKSRYALYFETEGVNLNRSMSRFVVFFGTEGVNLNRGMSRFVVLDCVTRLVFYGTEGSTDAQDLIFCECMHKQYRTVATGSD